MRNLENEKKPLLEEYLKNIREKVSRYGEVNLTAIHEFDEVQKRYDFLMTQKNDLESSISILEEAIKKIDETTQVRFTETFEAVDCVNVVTLAQVGLDPNVGSTMARQFKF